MIGAGSKVQGKVTLLAALALALPLTLNSASAVPVAIVDSGTDLGHPDLRDVKWTNVDDEDDAVDNDDNGYIDDLNGWNFAENDNQLFDKKLVGTFSKDVYRFFEIQSKMLNGSATPEELEWMKARRSDAAFIGELQMFGNFVHGSHVAGIAAAGSSRAQIMPLKLIPTKVPKPFSTIERSGMVKAARSARNDEAKKKLVLKAIDALGGAQAQVFGPIGGYLKSEGAKVANCSFGTSYTHIRELLRPLLQVVFGRTLPDDELGEYATYFITTVMKAQQKSFIQASPGTLFVIAAGNDGTDNDVMPASPANIRTENAITVAATSGTGKLASFSNFGAKMVDIAAPGVSIRSAIPGGESIELSGTSQAAPHVANIAGQILDINPKLKPLEVKKILMGTSDQKDFLHGKVASGGLLNGERAMIAAQHALSTSLDSAIARSLSEVKDQELVQSFTEEPRDILVLPLRSPIY